MTRPTVDVMKRRSTADGEQVKGRRPKTPEPKRGNAPKNALRRNPAISEKDAVIARLTGELREAFEQQDATSEVLEVIRSSPGDPQPVFQATLRNAVRLCDAKIGNIYHWDGDALHVVASHNTPPSFVEARRRSPFRADQSPIGRMITTKTLQHVVDASDVETHKHLDPTSAAAIDLGGTRTVLGVPMLRENELIGALVLARQEVRPFTDKQIELVNNFAAQAVIAIENARLLNELRQSFEQQTATGEILSSMSGSIADTKPVFDAIIRNLLRLFGTRFAVIQLLRDGMIHMAAFAGEPGFERVSNYFPRPLDDESFGARAMLLKEAFQFAPLIGNPAVPLLGQRTAHEFGFNSIICTPMIRATR
jgi:two-component system NtrC family sensor kinase